MNPPLLYNVSPSAVCDPLPPYLSTAVASVVGCRERATEASGTAQSQEAVETPQKGWEVTREDW